MGVLILFVTFFSALFAEVTPPHILAATKVRTESANKLAKKYDMVIFGAGGAMMEEVEEIGVAFLVYRPLNKCEARELLVNCVEEFLADINKSQELQPYLSVNPFGLKNVKVTLHSECPVGKDVCYPNFSIVSNRGETVAYSARQSEADLGYHHEEFEPYEKARALVMGG